MSYPSDFKFSNDHEWVSVDGDIATVGISEYAQGQLGDIVFVDLPSIGDTFDVGDSFGEVESVKSVSELISPVSGEVVETNDTLEGAPETINADPHGGGWVVKIRLSDSSELDDLMDSDGYTAYIEG